MMAKSHATLGVLSWISFQALTDQPLLEPLPIVLALLGSLLPDIDHPTSWVGQRSLILSYPIRWLFGHRNLTHSLLALIGFYWLIQNFPQQSVWLLPLAIGYASHLLADFFTSSGIPLFYPWKKRIAFVMTVNTGSLYEKIVVLGLVLACSLAFSAQLTQELKQMFNGI